MARPPRLLPYALTFFTLGCGQDQATVEDAEAVSAFRAFQEALFARDPIALRRTLCRDCRALARTLCETRRSREERLEPTHVTRQGTEIRVHLEDGKFFVLTKESGEIRVDLLSTTTYHSTTTRRRLEQPTFVPQSLTREQVRQAMRERTAAAPSR